MVVVVVESEASGVELERDDGGGFAFVFVGKRPLGRFFRGVVLVVVSVAAAVAVAAGTAAGAVGALG